MTTVVQKYSLDDILRVIGRFGRYQICVFVLICIGAGFSNQFLLNWVFTAGNMKYRCRISECENEYSNHEYEPHWLKSAVPYENNIPAPCTRYAFRNSSNSVCTVYKNFDKSVELKCSDWIFDSYEKTIIEDVCIKC